MPLYLLKFPYRKILLPMAKKMKFIDPDILGYLAVIVAAATMFCYLFAKREPLLLIISILLTFLRMTLNTIDGVIAIERGHLRLKGEIVNALPDRYSDIFIMAGLIFYDSTSLPWGVAALASVFLVSYTGMLSKAIGCNWQHDGPLGKVERLILIMIFSLMQYLSLIGKVEEPFGCSWFYLMFILFVILGQVTVYNRLRAQLLEGEKLDWIKYRESDNLITGRNLVVYDSATGNSKKCAQEMADALMCTCLELSSVVNLNEYDLVVFVSPNIRKKPSVHFQAFLDRAPELNNFAVLITAGMPIWHAFSTPQCFAYFENKLGKKALGTCEILGYHSKYKTFKGRPDKRDLLKAYLFAVTLMKKVRIKGVKKDSDCCA